MKLSVVIPCFNELATIESVIQSVKKCGIGSLEIIIVDDCSTDGTYELLRTLESQVDSIIYHSYNQGKGAALRSGFRSVTGDIVIVQDADLEYDPQEFSIVIEPILNGKADVV